MLPNSDKYCNIVQSPYFVKEWFEQYKLTPPFPWNDVVLPPYLYPSTCGFNTLDVGTDVTPTHWSVFNCTGSIVYWSTSGAPTDITCTAASGTNYSYLLRQGFVAGDMVGTWLVAGSTTDRGKIFHIGELAGYSFWFVPFGFSISANSIPTYVSDSGNYVWAKTLGYGSTYRLGMAIAKWDGSYRHGVLTGNAYNGETNSNIVVPLFCRPLGDWRDNGTCSPSSQYDTVGSRPAFNSNSLQLYSVVVPYRNAVSQSGYPGNCFVQFDGVLITPSNKGSLITSTFSMNAL